MANDKANGNKLGAGAARKVADTTPPKAPDVALVNDTGASDNDMLTRDGALALSGIESGAKLQYSTDGGATWKPKLKAQEGDNTVLVRQIDAAGNVSAPSAAVNFTLDKTPPKAPVAAFDMDSAAVLPIKLSRIEAGATVEYSADKGATWSTSFTPVLGDNTVQARQIDAAGNVSKPSAAVTFSYNWTGPLPVPEEPVSVDPLPPPPTAIATITAITDDTTGNDVAGPGVPRIGENDFVTWDQTLIVTAEVTGELAANEVVQISLDNGATWHNAEKVSGATWSYDAQNIVLAPGEYTFQARVSGVASSASKASTQVVKIGAYDLPDVPSFAIREYVDDVGPQTGNFSQGSVTNDTSPLLKGSWFILPWETPKIYDAESGAYLGDMKFSENIGWSFQLNDLADGKHSYYAEIVDNYTGKSHRAVDSLTGSDTFTFTVDTQPVVVVKPGTLEITAYIDDVGMQQGAFKSGTFTDDDSPLLVGVVAGLAEGETVKVYEGTTYLGDARVADTNWKFQLTGVTDGEHAYTTKVVDAAGNENAFSAPFTLSFGPVGTPPNTISITAIDSDTGTPGDFITADTELTFVGTLALELAAGESVQVSLDGGMTWQTVAVSGTQWRYEHAASLPEGDYLIEARLVDAAGNVGDMAARGFTVDFSKLSETVPSTKITGISPDSGVSADDYITNDGALTINGRLSEALEDGQTLQIDLDDGQGWRDVSVAAGSTDWSFDTSAKPLSDGIYTVTMSITDDNVTTTWGNSQVILVDTVAPTWALDGGVTLSADGLTLYCDFLLPFYTKEGLVGPEGEARELARQEVVRISIDGNTEQLLTLSGSVGSYTLAEPLGVGSHSVVFTVTDTAGNVTILPGQEVTVVGAENLPSTKITGISPDSGVSADDYITNDGALTINGRLSEALEDGQTLQINLDDGQGWRDVSVAAGSTDWSFDTSAKPLVDDAYTVQARVTDGADIGAAASEVILVDTYAPSVIRPEGEVEVSADRLMLSGSVGPMATLDVMPTPEGQAWARAFSEEMHISIDGGEEQPVTVDYDGWTYSLSAPLSVGSHTVVLSTMDTAGNTTVWPEQQVEVIGGVVYLPEVFVPVAGPCIGPISLSALVSASDESDSQIDLDGIVEDTPAAAVSVAAVSPAGMDAALAQAQVSNGEASVCNAAAYMADLLLQQDMLALQVA